jgi:Glycosyltransferase family 87
VFLLICSALARIPYSLSFFVFEALSLLVYLFAIRGVLDERGWRVLVPLLAFPEVFWALISGQNAFLSAALFATATLFIDRQPSVSDLTFGVLCYKPHLGLLVPVALAAGRRWRAFGAAVGSVIGFCLLSYLAFGWKAWLAFFAAARAARVTYQTASVWFSITPFGMMRMLGMGATTAYLV